MVARYLETRLGIGLDEEDARPVKILKKLLFFVPEANPGYEGKLHLVDRWLVEFPDGVEPYREIGLAEDGTVVVAGPSKENYGFWCDAGMEFDDFAGEALTREAFDAYWLASASLRGDEPAL